jgi:hypothetical protein
MKLIIAISVLFLFIAGCESTNKIEFLKDKSFITETKVTPSEKPHQYLIECTIIGRRSNATEQGVNERQILNSPKIIVVAEEYGMTKICDKDEQYGIFLSALVSEKDNKVTIKVILREKGNDLLNQTQIINIK